ncbi:hypothetical protein CC2G_001798 [Coprinopsis cinerea AmutBmut pab1-1]|nr:hypothetical protein CC2G_001798 [Coprinopsis cinerea AmutBmut pab1-1]
MTKPKISARSKRSPRYLYATYRTECEEAFPAAFEFTDERIKDRRLPVQPLYKPDIGVKIPVPMYFAGFIVSAGWHHHWNRRHGVHGADVVASKAVVDWVKLGSPEPFLAPRVYPYPTGDNVIYFITHLADRRDIDYFYDNRDAILDRFLDVLSFPSDEKDIIKTRLFKWHRVMPTTMSALDDLKEDLPEDMCLQYTGPIPDEFKSEYNSASESESESD